MRDFTFHVRAPELHLRDDLDQISHGIWPSATPVRLVRVDEPTATLFRPHLESDWGSLYSALPDFFNQFLRGRWRGNDQQHLPTTLVGDFGEFLTACVLRTMGATRVARVIRASHLHRPDFVAYFPARREVLAIEVKAGSLNGSKLEEATWNASRAGHKYQLNICSLLRNRREDGIEQIAATTGTPGRRRPPRGRPWDLGHARVPAHRTAVATPYFIDGRISQAGTPWAQHSTPKACRGLRCRDCVLPGARDPLPVLLPIFYNSEVILRPLPPPEDLERYVGAHALAARAVWTGSESLFHSAWRQFVSLFHADSALRKDNSKAANGHLLDILAAGVEAEVVQSTQLFLKEAGLTGAVFEAVVEEQLLEAESKSLGAMSTPRWQSGSKPEKDWEEFWRTRPQKRSRSRRRLPALEPEDGVALRNWVKETSSEQTTQEATLEIPGATVFWLPVDPDEQAEFRIAAEKPDTTRQVVDEMLKLFGGGRPDAHRSELKIRDGEVTYITVRDGPLLTGEAFISAEGTAIVRGRR